MYKNPEAFLNGSASSFRPHAYVPRMHAQLPPAHTQSAVDPVYPGHCAFSSTLSSVPRQPLDPQTAVTDEQSSYMHAFDATTPATLNHVYPSHGRAFQPSPSWSVIEKLLQVSFWRRQAAAAESEAAALRAAAARNAVMHMHLSDLDEMRKLFF